MSECSVPRETFVKCCKEKVIGLVEVKVVGVIGEQHHPRYMIKLETSLGGELLVLMVLDAQIASQ